MARVAWLWIQPYFEYPSWEQPLKRAGQPVEIVVTHMDGRKKHIPVF